VKNDEVSFSDHGNPGGEGTGVKSTEDRMMIELDEAGKVGGLGEGLSWAALISTLGRGEEDTPRFLVPLIFANSNKGVMVLAAQWADGSMELPAITANEALAESIILRKTKSLIPSCVQCRLIQCLRTGVHTITIDNGKLHLLFAFLNAKMDNAIKDKLKSLDWDWFTLEILDSELNEELDYILLKGFTTKLIAEWLKDAEVHRGILFEDSFSDILKSPWLEGATLSSGKEGTRRRKQIEISSSSGSRIHGKDGLPGPVGPDDE
ncbi:hypothetical protein CBR_g76927, partial [Chara braunii]